MTNGDDKLQLRIHLASGKAIDVVVDDNPEDLDVEDYIEERIKGREEQSNYGKPRWTWIGAFYGYTQVIEGVEVL